MAQQTLSAKKIAIMVAANFDETQFINIQKAMMASNAWLKVVSNKSGLVNGAKDGMLGMAYPVDALLSETLAIDYDALIIPGGAKHISTLAQEPHAIRILRAFMREEMPVLFIDDATSLLGESGSDITDSDFGDDAVSAVKHVVKANADASLTEALALLAEAFTASDEEQAA
ncbi:MAG: DJ-1/PfpI family protein [Candidatus Puniceispirillaceae bacterium]